MLKVTRFPYWLGPILFVTLCLPALHARASAPQDKDDKAKESARTETVTGCLQKSEQPGAFSITGEDGRAWQLESSNVKLEDHAGHKVTVTGSVAPDSKAAEKKQEGQVEKASSQEEYGKLLVTSLKMVSKTCGK
jgi:hypothetical protein